MKIVYGKNVNEVATEVHQRLQELTLSSTYPLGLRAFFPAGNSPRPLYKLICSEANFWRGRLHPIQIDEFRDPQRPFFSQLDKELFQPLNITQPEIWDISGDTANLNNYVEKTLSRKIHVALLGLGPNGHVGFHEPGLAASFRGGDVTVTEETRARVQNIATNKALTFGAAAFLLAQEIIMIVCGEEKRLILERLITSTIDPNLPASLLKNHPHFTVFTDLSI